MGRSVSVVLFASLLTAFATRAVADQGPFPETAEALQAEYAKLQWIEAPGTYDLPKSNGKISFAAGRSMLIGPDAERLLYLMNAREFPRTEAVLYDDANEVIVTFEFTDEGYVTDEDWTDVDPDAFLKSMSEGTEAANEERAKYGIAPLHVRGWLSEPTYDAASNTVTWAVELDDGGEAAVNSTALKLSRYGYEEFTWVGSAGKYEQQGGLLDTALADHAFDEGYRYADFQDGDKVATYGIAALVAAVAGATLGKGLIATILAVALLLLKKGWVVILLVFGGIGAAIRKVFGGGRNAAGEG